MKNTKDMTKGSPWKVIVLFAIPVFLSNLFQQLYNSADSLIVGNILGKNALAAVASSGSLIWLFTSFFYGMAAGAGVLVSRYFGEKNYDKMNKIIHTNIAFGLLAGIFLTIAGVIFTPTILKLMKTDQNVLPESISYFRVYFLGITGNILYNTFSSTLQSVGNSKRPLIYLVISSILNIILDLIFIGVFRWGVWAAAFATTIAQITSAILCLIYLMKPNTTYQVKLKEIKIDTKLLKEILVMGIPTGIQNSVIGLANVVVQSNINSFGDNAMAGCGAYQKLEGFAFLPVTSFTMALTAYIGQNLGAKEYKRAKKGAYFGIFTSVFLSELIGLIMYILAPNLIYLFIKDPNAVEFGVRYIRTVTLAYFMLAFSHCVASVLRGAGRAIVPMLVMLIVWCGIRVLYITIAMHFKHDIGLLLLAYPITWFISSVIYFINLVFSDWVHGFEKLHN